MTSVTGERHDCCAIAEEEALDKTAGEPVDHDRDRNAKFDSATASLSKNAQKKLLKAQRLEELKPAKRQAERERRKARRAEAKQAGLTISPRLKAPPVDRKVVNAALVIDLGFDALMTEKELASMTSQLSILYSYNRLASHAFSKIILCGSSDADVQLAAMGRWHGGDVGKQGLLESRLGRRMESIMQGCWKRWQNVELRDVGGLEAIYEKVAEEERPAESAKVFDKDKLVYLTADSDTVLDTIREEHAYIVGGLVDRNRYKTICAEKARLLGLRTARLPISSDRMRTSQVLTVNQVVHILLAFIQLRDWDKALDLHLPRRKIREDP